MGFMKWLKAGQTVPEVFGGIEAEFEVVGADKPMPTNPGALNSTDDEVTAVGKRGTALTAAAVGIDAVTANTVGNFLTVPAWATAVILETTVNLIGTTTAINLSVKGHLNASDYPVGQPLSGQGQLYGSDANTIGYYTMASSTLYDKGRELHTVKSIPSVIQVSISATWGGTSNISVRVQFVKL